jgi:K+-transporting ATPase KdpF subunit
MPFLCTLPAFLAPFRTGYANIQNERRVYARPDVSGNRRRFCRGDLGSAGAFHEASGRQEMITLYLLAGLISLGLLVYLLLALMKPEWFE